MLIGACDPTFRPIHACLQDEEGDYNLAAAKLSTVNDADGAEATPVVTPTATGAQTKSRVDMVAVVTEI